MNTLIFILAVSIGYFSPMVFEIPIDTINNIMRMCSKNLGDFSVEQDHDTGNVIHVQCIWREPI